MPILTHLVKAALLAICLVSFTACNDTQSPKPASTSNSSDEKDAGHGEDGHDHGKDGHDEDANEHAKDDGHDHDKGDHDHGEHEQIDASKAGLSADDLVTIDGPEIPDNFNDAVTAFGKMATQIGDGFKNNKIDDAHGPLHDVGNFLEGIEELAKKSSLDKAAKTKVSEAIDQLFDAYGAIDEKLHDAKKGKDYADVADDIEKAMKTLKSFVKQ